MSAGARVAWTVAALAAAGIALWVAALALDLDTRRAEVAAWLSRETGLEVEIHGGLSLRPMIWPRVTVDDLSVSNRVDGQVERIADVEQLSLVLNPLDLLIDGLRIDAMEIRGARVSLVRDALGRDHWLPQRPGDGGEGFHLLLESARVTDSVLVFRNEKAEAETRLELSRLSWTYETAEPADLEVVGTLDGLPLALRAKTQLQSDGPPGTPLHEVSVDGEIL